MEPVHVFVPGREVAPDRIECPFYDDPEYPNEIGRALEDLGLSWRWLPVTHQNLKARVEEAAAAGALVFNLCDGVDESGIPGVSVVRALTRRGAPFTGADACFYSLTTGRDRMKHRLTAGGISQPGWIPLPRDPEAPLPPIRFPVIVKPDVSGGACGIELTSVVRDEAELRAQARRLLGGIFHGQDFSRCGLIVEDYIEGPEMSVLLTGDWYDEGHLRVHTPVERHFAGPWPHILTYERNWERWDRETPPPGDDPPYFYQKVTSLPPEEVAALARRAYLATGGVGFGRVDLRLDAASGALMVLEVNANCGISSNPRTSTVGAVLAAQSWSLSNFLGEIIEGARRRSLRRPERVQVCYPCRSPEDRDCDGYEDPEFQEELGDALSELDVRVEWCRVHKTGDPPEGPAFALPPDLVLNLCDGDDRRMPGLSVVNRLERLGAAYTGADAGFYARTTAKTELKSFLRAAGVDTPASVTLDAGIDDFLRAAESTLGYPYLLKPDISAGSFGIERTSLIHDEASARAQLARLEAGLHYGVSLAHGVFAEEFIPGREFTVLVCGSFRALDSLLVFAPLEYRFASTLVEEERFLFYDRRYGYDASEGVADRYEYAPVEEPLGQRLREFARRAFLATSGHGYARVDLRLDRRDGRPKALEVNANCGLRGSPTQSTVGAILHFSREPYSHLLARILQLAGRAPAR